MLASHIARFCGSGGPAAIGALINDHRGINRGGAAAPTGRRSHRPPLPQAGAQLINWFGVACELHRDWRNDVEGLATLLSNHIPDYRNLMTSYAALKG
jgi:hypothetical protein